MLTRQPKDRAVGGQLLPVEIPEDHADSDLNSRLVREYRRQLFRQAAEHVRTRADATTWQAFAMTMIDGRTIAEAAERLQRSEAVIYAARSRIMRRLRDTVKDMEEDADECSS